MLSLTDGALHHLGFLVTVTSVAPSIALLPVAVRLFAHPKRSPLPASAAAAATTGVVVSLFWTAGGLGLLAARWLMSGSSALTGSIPARFILVGVAAAVATGMLLTTGRVRGIRAAGCGERARRSQAARPDLVDDLATLTARAFPGSGVARALATLNRRVDSWAATYQPEQQLGSRARRLARLISTAISRIGQTRPQPDRP